MQPIDLLKSHVDAYTKTNGTVVNAHDDKRVAASKPAPIGTHAAALRASSKPGDLDHEDNQYAADIMDKGDHKQLAGHLKGLDTAARDHILDHVHPDHREGLGFQQINMDRSKKQYADKFPAKSSEKAKPNQEKSPSGSPLLQAKEHARALSKNANETDHRDDHAAAMDAHAMAGYYAMKGGHSSDEHDKAVDLHRTGMMHGKK